MKVEKAKISIIVPIYLIKEEYLRKNIECLIGQTLKQIEILLIDDGSPDQSGRICEEYAKKDVRIRVFHQKNRGVSVARNVGIENASGEYIMFVDPDDWLDLDCCEHIINVLEKEKVEAVFFQSCEEYGKFTKWYSEKNVWFYDMRRMQISTLKQERLQYCCPVDVPWGKVIKRDCLINNFLRFQPGVLISQDALFNLQLYERLTCIFCAAYTGYHYRQNSGSINYRYNPNMEKIIKDFIIEAEKFIFNYHYNDNEYKKALGARCITMLGRIEKTYFFHKESKLSFKQIYNGYLSYINDEVISKYIKICNVKDCDNLKMKIRCLLLKEGKMGLCIYYFLAIFYQKINMFAKGFICK